MRVLHATLHSSTWTDTSAMSRPPVELVCREDLAAHLSRNSAPYSDPVGRIQWGELRLDRFWLPEAAISLQGVSEFDRLPQAQRQRLSQMEFINFIQMGIWVENLFIERIARGLRHPPDRLAEHRYLLHQIREEAGHSLMFLELIDRSGLPRLQMPARGLRLAAALGRHLPYDWLGFWLAVTIGEEIPDRLNRYLRRHGDAVDPVIRDLVTTHVVDEARHIAYARCRAQKLLDGAYGPNVRSMALLMRPILRQFVRAFYFPGPAVYRAAGLEQAETWVLRARTNRHRLDFVEQCVRPVLRSFETHGLRLDWR